MSRYQKGKTNLDFTEARDSEWQWHQLDRMQVCTSLQTDNHASTPPLSFLQAGCPSCHPTNSVKALKAINKLTETIPLIVYSLFSKPVISCFASRASSTAGPTLDVVNPNFGLLPTWNGSLPSSTSELLVTLECNKICLVLEPHA